MTVVALLLAGLLLLAGPAEEATPVTASGPEIRVDPEGFDFGRAQPRRTLRKTFSLRNAGDQDLVLQKPRTSCGCTVAALTVSTLGPGRSTPLAVTLATGDTRGRLEKSVLVPSNDPRKPLLEIKLRVIVESAAER